MNDTRLIKKNMAHMFSYDEKHLGKQDIFYNKTVLFLLNKVKMITIVANLAHITTFIIISYGGFQI